MVSVGDKMTAAAFNALAARVPYLGTFSGPMSSSTAVVVTHGLGFTPSKVFVQGIRNTPATDPILPIAAFSLTSTTFTVRLAAFALQAGSNYYTQLVSLTGLTVQFDWLAWA